MYSQQPQRQPQVHIYSPQPKANVQDVKHHVKVKTPLRENQTEHI